MTDLTRAELAVVIRKAVEQYGGPEKFARKLDVLPEYIQHCVNGKKPGPRLLKAVGVIETDGRYRQLEKK